MTIFPVTSSFFRRQRHLIFLWLNVWPLFFVFVSSHHALILISATHFVRWLFFVHSSQTIFALVHYCCPIQLFTQLTQYSKSALFICFTLFPMVYVQLHWKRETGLSNSPSPYSDMIIWNTSDVAFVPNFHCFPDIIFVDNYAFGFSVWKFTS